MINRRMHTPGLLRRGLRAPAGGGAFTPSAISNVIEWWIARDGVSIVSGTPDEGATWLGQKAGYLLPAASASQRPFYQADGANFSGESVLHMDEGDDRYFHYDANAELIAATTRLTVLVLGRRLAVPAANQAIAQLSSAAAQAQVSMTARTDGNIRSLQRGSGSLVVDSAGSTTAGWFRSRWALDNTHGMTAPGQAEGTVTTTGQYAGAVEMIGTGGAAGGTCDFAMAGMVICSSDLSAADYTAIQDYYAQFYG